MKTETKVWYNLAIGAIIVACLLFIGWRAKRYQDTRRALYGDNRNIVQMILD